MTLLSRVGVIQSPGPQNAKCNIKISGGVFLPSAGLLGYVAILKVLFH
jgi:hypothetical protein